MRFSEQCTDPEVGRMLGVLLHEVFFVAAHLASAARWKPRRPPDNPCVTQADHSLPLFDFREPLSVSAWTPIDYRAIGGVSVICTPVLP